VTDNILCQVTLDDGTQGWGEGLPRTYVTGETTDSCFDEFDRRGAELLECRGDSLPELVTWLDAYAPTTSSAEADPIELAPTSGDPRYLPYAYWCACETALLDAFGRSLGFSLTDVVAYVAGTEALQPKPFVQYSAVLSTTPVWRQCLLAGAMLLAGFHSFKAKVGFSVAEDARRTKWLRRTIGANDLRLDANGAWPPADAEAAVEALAPYKPTCVEQPLAPGNESITGDLRRLGVPIMLDESVRSLTEAREAITQGWCDLVNIRISKCGGPVASVRLLAAVGSAGGRAQLGCQVGETGLLSAAGRHLACNLAGLEYLEGSYDRYLLAAQLTEPDITFGSGGWAPQLRGPGLGVTVRPKALERFSVRCSAVAW
jgi:muconate cycloisomerase